MMDVPVEKRLILDFFYEVFCPFCRRVKVNIVDKLEMKNIVIINPVDVDANLGCVEMDWYRRFCAKVKSEPTPLLRLHDRYLDESSWNHVFLMWRKKPMTITEEVLSSEEYLEKQLYDKIREYQRTLVFPVQQSYELDCDRYLRMVHGLNLEEK